MAGKAFLGWPVLRQLTGKDPLGRGPAVRSARTDSIRPRTAEADRVARSEAVLKRLRIDHLRISDGDQAVAEVLRLVERRRRVR